MSNLHVDILLYRLSDVKCTSLNLSQLLNAGIIPSL